MLHLFGKLFSNKPIYIKKKKDTIFYSVNFPFVTSDWLTFHILGLKKINDRRVVAVIRNILTCDIYEVDIDELNHFYKKFDKYNLLFKSQLSIYNKKIHDGTIPVIEYKKFETLFV